MRLQYLRCFLPAFRFFNFHGGRPVAFALQEPEGSEVGAGPRQVRLDPEVRLRFWNLFLNHAGNLLLWEETLLRNLLEHPGDPGLVSHSLRVLRARADACGIEEPKGGFRLVLEGGNGEVFQELRIPLPEQTA